MRTPPGGAPPCSWIHRCARSRSRWAFCGVTAAIGCWNPPPLRVLTSQRTRTSPSLATMSISPVLPQRQLRSRTVIPASVSRRAARSSPYLPSALRAFMSAPPPAPTVTHLTKRSGSWWTTRRLWITSSPARQLQVALVQLLDVHVLECENADLLHETRRAVHVPHPRVRHRHLEEHLTLDRVHLHLVVVGEVEAPLGLDHVFEQTDNIAVLPVELQLHLGLVLLEVLGAHGSFPFSRAVPPLCASPV